MPLPSKSGLTTSLRSHLLYLNGSRGADVSSWFGSSRSNYLSTETAGMKS